MAGTLTIRIEDHASPALQSLIADIRNAKPMLRSAGAGVAELLRDHFAGLEESRPNRMGWERQHFWSQVRGTVHMGPVTDDTAEVSISDFRFRQKVEGGPILPTHGTYLTIPAVEEAYGKSAREFSDLKFGFAEDPSTGAMRPALIAQRGVATYIERGKRAKYYKAVAEEVGKVALFWLVRRVMQAPTEGAMPDDAEILEAGMEGAEQWATTRLAQMNN